VEVDALLDRGGVEAAGHLRVEARRLAVRRRLGLQPEEQAEARAEALDPDGQAGPLEDLPQAAVQGGVELGQVAPELGLDDLVEERVGRQDRDQVGVEGPAVDGAAAGARHP
jgi:hypothetical protein